jgi:hypothetical protein
MDGPDYAKVPEYVKVYLRRGGDAFMSEAPDLGRSRTRILRTLRVLLLAAPFQKTARP